MLKQQTFTTILLTFSLCLNQGHAFGTVTKPEHLRSATLFRSTTPSIGESDFPQPVDQISCPQTPDIASYDGDKILRSTGAAIAKNGTTTKRLIWACMLLWVAQCSSHFPTFSNALQNTPKNVAAATLTSSFLRQSQPGRRIPPKLLVAMALLFPHLGKVVGASASFLSRCTNWYVGSLEAFPLLTKACSAAVIGFLGDTAAQQFEERTRTRREGPNASPIKYDLRRGVSIIADGLFVTGPILHFVYDFLENLIPVSGSSLPPSLAAISQVLLDDIFVDSLFVATTFIFTGITEGYGKRTITQFKTDFVPTVKAGWAASLMLMPLEFTCFRFLPVSFRVLGMNFVDIVWDGVLSYQVHRTRIRMAREDAEAAKKMNLHPEVNEGIPRSSEGLTVAI